MSHVSEADLRQAPSPLDEPLLPQTSAVVIALIAFLFVFVPPLLFIKKFPVLAPFYMFAGDAYYYFDIAKNSHLAGFFTFDGQHATNGFHPLWQFFLSLLTKWRILNFEQPLQLLDRVLVVQAVLVSLAAGIFCAFAAPLLSRRWLALFIVAPGPLWFPMALVASGYLSTWSNLNGMECCLELFLFAIAIFIYKEEDRSPAIFSFMLGLVVLARLDDVFYLLAFVAIALLRAPQERRIKVAMQYLPGFIVILAYVTYSKWSAGTFLPISGAAKAGLGVVTNTKAIVKLFVPIAAWDTPRMIAPLYSYSLFAEGTMRIAQMVLPMLICGLELGYRWKKKLKLYTLTSCLCLGTLLKCCYNFFFVSLGNQGSWYYAVPIFTANFIVVVWIDRLLQELLAQTRFRMPRLVILCAQACFVLLFFNVFINHKLNETGASLQYKRMLHPGLVRGDILSLGQRKFVEFADGEIGFESDLPSVAGFGLALDKEASIAVKEGRFFDLLQQRGYVLFAAVDDYGVSLDNYLDTKAWTHGSGLWELKPSEFLGHSVEKVLYDKSLGLYVYRLR
jgi:hypothetical protein